MASSIWLVSFLSYSNIVSVRYFSPPPFFLQQFDCNRGVTRRIIAVFGIVGIGRVIAPEIINGGTVDGNRVIFTISFTVVRLGRRNADLLLHHDSSSDVYDKFDIWSKIPIFPLLVIYDMKFIKI